MQKSKIKVLISVLLILVLATSYCFATSNSEETPLVTTLEETAEDSNTTRENETNTDSNKKILSSNDIYICDSRVNISQLVDGNAFIIGDDVTISGEVGGDVFVIANKLTIDGSYIYNSVFAIANEININGVVYDVYSSCRTFNLQENGYIYRDLKLIADNVNISGRVKRNAYISANSINISDNSGMLIGGNIEYFSSNEITIPDGSVGGNIKYNQVSENNENNFAYTYIYPLASTVFLALVITLLLLWLAPKFVDKTSNTSKNELLKALGIGIITPILLAIIGVILAIIVIGVPALIFVLAMLFILSIIGMNITNIFFGKLIANKTKQEGKAKLILFTILVSVIIWLLSLIPYVGGLIMLLDYIFGLGLTIMNIIPKKNKQVVKEDAE